MFTIALAWLAAHLPAILAVVPSVVVGATKSATLPTWLSRGLQIVSVLTHKDAPGTLKPPLTIR